MRIITKGRLRDFWQSHPAYRNSERALRAWYAETVRAKWLTPADVKAQSAMASILPKGRVVFNVGGNKYRLIVHINYAYQTVYIRFIGTHEQYDAIDAQTI